MEQGQQNYEQPRYIYLEPNIKAKMQALIHGVGCEAVETPQAQERQGLGSRILSLVQR